MKIDDSNKKRSVYKNPFAWIILVLGLSGLYDAIVLSFLHLNTNPYLCATGSGCDLVNSSSYSILFGIPLAYLGVIYYLAVLIVFLFMLASGKKVMLHALRLIVLVGLIFSIWFVYLQFYVIEAICQYCMFSALSTLLLNIFLWLSVYDVE